MKSLEVAGTSIFSSGVKHIYVRDADGLDSNPGTDALPIKTLTEAIRRFPRFIEDPIVVHIGPHATDGYVWPTMSGFIQRANVYFLGDGGGAIGDDGKNVLLASGTVGVGSGYENVVTSGLGTDDYWGKTIEFLDGSLAGFRRTINQNTPTSITMLYSVLTPPSDGDTYQIFEPNTEIIFTPADNYNQDCVVGTQGSAYKADNSSEKKYGVYFINIRAKGGFVNEITVSNATVVLCGVETAAAFAGYGLILLVNSGGVLIGVDSSESTQPYQRLTAPVDDLGVASSDMWVGWGLSVVDGSCIINHRGSGYGVEGFFCIDGDLRIYGGSIVRMNNGRFYRLEVDPTLISYHSGGGIVLTAYHELGAVTHTGRILVTNDSSQPSIDVNNVAVFLNRLDISGTGNAILLHGPNARCYLHHVYGAVNGIGIVVEHGGAIQIESEVPQIVAAGGGFKVGDSHVHDFSELVAGDEYFDISSGSVLRFAI